MDILSVIANAINKPIITRLIRISKIFNGLTFTVILNSLTLLWSGPSLWYPTCVMASALIIMAAIGSTISIMGAKKSIYLLLSRLTTNLNMASNQLMLA